MDRRGRVTGMVVFVLGIAVLLFVFGIAYSMFTSPADELLPPIGGTAVGLGNALAIILAKTLLLFIMTLAGSWIAGRGVQLYLGSGERPRPGGSRGPREASRGVSETGGTQPRA